MPVTFTLTVTKNGDDLHMDHDVQSTDAKPEEVALMDYVQSTIPANITALNLYLAHVANGDMNEAH